MAEPQSSDRLQPCLLDRLVVDNPKEASGYRYYERHVSHQDYRRGVARDLEWLLNTRATLLVRGDPVRFRNRWRRSTSSVINFGVVPFVGMSITRMDEVRDRIMEAIRRFEPRIIPSSLDVSVKREDGNLGVRIRGFLWANPVPESLDIRSRIDLETGRCTLSGGANG